MAADGGESRWASRSRAREAALQILYQMEVGQLTVTDATRMLGVVGAPDISMVDDGARAYAVSLARGAWEDHTAIDERIADAARNWRVERMAVLDRMVLRLAVHELLAYPETPPRVVIDEAIDLARRYSGDEAAKFVNGVLDGVFRKLKDEGKVTE
jgi:transcription antitermination protein NusB